MIFNEIVIGQHPAESGYILECLVRGNEDPNDFPLGSGRLKVEFPKFDVTGLEFQGKNLLFLPTGEEEEEKLMDNIIVLEKNINLRAFFSGDLNLNNFDENGDFVSDGLAIQNIKNIDVYTGDIADFTPDTLEFSNRVAEFPVTLSAGEESFDINITDTEIDSRVEENIHYKVIPTDYLTFGEESVSVSGLMFSGFDKFPKINEENVTNGQFLISRSNGNDAFAGGGELVEIFTGCTIVIDGTIPLDFYGTFRIRTDQTIKISGGLDADSVQVPLQSTINNLSVSNNTITIVGTSNNEFNEFDIANLLDENNERQAYIIGDL